MKFTTFGLFVLISAFAAPALADSSYKAIDKMDVDYGKYDDSSSDALLCAPKVHALREEMHKWVDHHTESPATSFPTIKCHVTTPSGGQKGQKGGGSYEKPSCECQCEKLCQNPTPRPMGDCYSFTCDLSTHGDYDKVKHWNWHSHYNPPVCKHGKSISQEGGCHCKCPAHEKIPCTKYDEKTCTCVVNPVHHKACHTTQCVEGGWKHTKVSCDGDTEWNGKKGECCKPKSCPQQSGQKGGQKRCRGSYTKVASVEDTKTHSLFDSPMKWVSNKYEKMSDALKYVSGDNHDSMYEDQQDDNHYDHQDDNHYDHQEDHHNSMYEDHHDDHDDVWSYDEVVGGCGASHTNLPGETEDINLPGKAEDTKPIEETNLPGETEDTNLPGKAEDTNLPGKAEDTKPIEDTNLPGETEETNLPGETEDTNLPGETEDTKPLEETNIPGDDTHRTLCVPKEDLKHSNHGFINKKRPFTTCKSTCKSHEKCVKCVLGKRLKNENHHLRCVTDKHRNTKGVDMHSVDSALEEASLWIGDSIASIFTNEDTHGDFDFTVVDDEITHVKDNRRNRDL
jgi:hypothetical protein